MYRAQLMVVGFFAASSLLCILLPERANGQSSRAWCTYYGGSGEDENNSIATDASGNVYMTGYTDSPNNIASSGFQNTMAGDNDAFLVKFDSSGNRVWARYFGGEGDDYGWGIAIDAGGNIYLSGATNSTTGVATSGLKQTQSGGLDAFLVKFDAAGNRLWGTYFGGSGNDEGWNVTTDVSGNVYMTGRTGSKSGIALNGFQNAYGGGVDDVFLVKYTSSGHQLWATYYGGPAEDEGFGLATDLNKNVYVGGWTQSSSGVSFHGFQNPFSGSLDGFLVKFDSSGNRTWGTYYGSGGDDVGCSVATDNTGNVYLAGKTDSPSGIATNGSCQDTLGNIVGLYDDFLAKFDADGNRLWGTYYGGPSNEELGTIATDASGNVYLSGNTYSASGIASGGFRNNLIGLENQFVVKFDGEGNRQCATYYGENDGQNGHIAVDAFGHVYLAAYTTATTGISSGGFQNTFGGGTEDAYLVRFNSCANISGVAPVDRENEWTIYPNPVNDILIVKTDQADRVIKGVEVFDLLGRTVRSEKSEGINPNSFQLDVSNLNAGMYYVKITTREFEYIQPIIKQ